MNGKMDQDEHTNTMRALPTRITEIIKEPTTFSGQGVNLHESIFRNFHILQKAKDWMRRGVPSEVILELVEEMEQFDGVIFSRRFANQLFSEIVTRTQKIDEICDGMPPVITEGRKLSKKDFEQLRGVMLEVKLLSKGLREMVAVPNEKAPD